MVYQAGKPDQAGMNFTNLSYTFINNRQHMMIWKDKI